ncbi:MAG TPA: aminotransferase class I/II-fold pyridoxal phosphate-dependent enzyme [Anaerolineae bacterium]
MEPAKRLNAMPLYVFATLAARLKALQTQGLDVIRMDMGGPDAPPPNFIIEAMTTAAQDPEKHNYAGYFGTPQLREAIVDYYARRFGVTLSQGAEVLPLLGSKEGIANMALAWLDPGDLALVPDPGYPTYRMSVAMAGAESYNLPLLAENGFLPDLKAIPPEVTHRARLMWLNYPNNPTGAVASLEFLAEAVAYCREHEILLCFDAPYADVAFNGYRAPSVLEIEGAKEVAIEFNSLSKSHNMAGWRVGMAVGNQAAVAALLQIKSNVDSGIFLPVQDAAAAALCGDQAWLAGRNAEYQRRRDLVCDVVANTWGLAVAKPVAGLYLWPRVPKGYTSTQFTEKILLETGVSFTAGSEFGPHGEGYFRISVGQKTDRIMEAVRRLRSFRF